MTQLFTITDLHTSIEDKQILKGLNLLVGPGEIHAIMGPNGAGKSTLAKALMGHPEYTITQGTVTLEGVNLLELEPEERARYGLFLGFQYPLEISGISNRMFLHHAYQSLYQKEIDEEVFQEKIQPQLEKLRIEPSFLERHINVGFSGGEKKRNEILQLLVLDPKVALLDETDSGLDIDAMKIVADGVRQFMNQDKGLVLITHYQRLLEYIRPDYVHIMVDGKIVKTGSYELAMKLEKQGYETLMQEKSYA